MWGRGAGMARFCCLPYLLLAALVSTVLLHISPHISSSPSPLSLPLSLPLLLPFLLLFLLFLLLLFLLSPAALASMLSIGTAVTPLPLGICDSCLDSSVFSCHYMAHSFPWGLHSDLAFLVQPSLITLSSVQTHNSSSSVISQDLLASFPLTLPSFLFWFIFPSQSSPLDWKYQVRTNLCLFYSVLSPQCLACACLIQTAPKIFVGWINNRQLGN